MLRILVPSLLAATVTLPAGAQELRDCTGCEVGLEEVAVLGGVEAGEGFVGRPHVVLQFPDGRYLLADRHDQGRLKFYDPDGRFLRSVGREGEGPGEYQIIQSVTRLEDGSLEVWDLGQLRITRLGPDFEVIETTRIELNGVWVAALPDRSRVMVSMIPTPGSAGLPLHWIDPSGGHRRSFGADPPIEDLRDWERHIRHIAPASDTSVWAAHYLAYVLEEWSISGTLLRRLERNVDWFPPVDDGGWVDSESPPNPSNRQIHANEDGSIWVATWIADEDWRDGLQQRRDPYGRSYTGYNQENPGWYFDTVLELIDPDAGAVLGSVRVDEAIMGFVNDTLAYGYRMEGEAELSIPIFRMLRP